MENNQSIVFAIYRNGEFQGFRTDTMGSVSKGSAKIYEYSREQVDIVMRNIEHNLKGATGLGKLLKSPELEKNEEKIYKENYENATFEVRILKGPTAIYEENFNVKTATYEKDWYPSYNAEELRDVLLNPDEQEVLETHYFSMESKLNMS